MISRSNLFIIALLILGMYFYQSKISEKPKIDHIAVVNIKGSAIPINYIQWEYYLWKAIKNKNAKAIIIKVNCYGGYGYNHIKDLIEYAATKKPTVGYIQKAATSAGYGIISSAKINLFAQQTSVVGSIGSWNQINNFDELHKYLGYKQEIIYDNKSFNQLYNPSNPKHEEQILNSIKKYCEKIFFKRILDNRNIDKKHFNGKWWLGDEAKQYNFVDHIITHIDEIKEFLITNHNINKELDYKEYNIKAKVYRAFFRPSDIISLIQQLINILIT